MSNARVLSTRIDTTPDEIRSRVRGTTVDALKALTRKDKRKALRVIEQAKQEAQNTGLILELGQIEDLLGNDKVADDLATRAVERDERIYEQIVFDRRSNRRNQQIRKELDDLAKSLRNSGNRIVIEGHAYDMETEDENIKISICRAMAVKSYLSDSARRYRISENRIAAYGFGSSCRKGFDFSEPDTDTWRQHRTSAYLVKADSPTFCVSPQVQISDVECSKFQPVELADPSNTPSAPE